MIEGRGERSRARDVWRWCSLVPFVGAVPMCVAMARRRRTRWAFGAGVVTMLWFVSTGIAGGSRTNGARTAVGLAILGLYVAQIVLSFSAPAGKSAGGRGPRRARWLWLSVIPLLGSWLPALAGLRARIWWWVLLGVACEGVAIDAVVQLARSNHHSPAQGAKLGSLLLIGWLGGVSVSMLIRPVYERRVLDTVINRHWPSPTEPARALVARYALGAYLCALALIALIVAAEKASKNTLFSGVANIVGETLTVMLLIPLIRSRRLRPRDIGLRRTLPVPGSGYAVLALVGYLLAISVWIVLIPQTTLQAAHRLTAVNHRPGGFAAVLILAGLAVVAPVCEEVFFRGMLYRSLRNRLSLWPAVLIAGSLFGLIHIFAYPLSTIPVKIVFGILMCLLYERTGSLLPGIAVHSFVDGTAADVAVTGNSYAALAVYGLLLLAVLARRPRPGASPNASDSPVSESPPRTETLPAPQSLP
jgi:CAAX protease family protein